MALTIAAHVAMFAGQSLVNVWIEKDQLVKDFKLESLSCRQEGDCCFDCVSLFSVFLESEKCMKDGKIHGDGEIKTDCGTAGYTAVRHNRVP